MKFKLSLHLASKLPEDNMLWRDSGAGNEPFPDRAEPPVHSGTIVVDHSNQEDPLIRGSSSFAIKLREQVRILAGSSASVLIKGESGTGKDLVAMALHNQSPRVNGPFIAVNCSALSPGILESELFGHSRGAFTGAVRSHAGFFEQADGGTLFLDEIGEMSGHIQAKLLRVLQNREVRRMGGTGVRRVDIRLISATNTDLDARLMAGTFRKDLYYRINVVEIVMQSLRKRAGDIMELIAHFYRMKRLHAPHIERAAGKILLRYPWPGNVRELENEVERLIALNGNHAAIKAEMLSDKIRFHDPGIIPLDMKILYDAPLSKAVGELEQDILKRALASTNWNKSKTARQLGLSRQGLLKKIKRYGLSPAPFIIGNSVSERDGSKDED